MLIEAERHRTANDADEDDEQRQCTAPGDKQRSDNVVDVADQEGAPEHEENAPRRLRWWYR